MNHRQNHSQRSVRAPAYRQTLQRLDEALGRDQTSRAYQDWEEEEKLTQARLALFGSAPK